MSIETYEDVMRQNSMYHDLEISAKQKEEGKVKDARKSLEEIKAKYDL